MNGTVVVRFAFGVVGESRRQAHLSTAPESGLPEHWLTFCGLEIPATLAEVSAKPAGMPCMPCLSFPGGTARTLPGPP
ncbi:hypothetical protein [Saccharopolyspora pogona]|uniref:hypothetical protein n=1 Tax=Saccharopolyspora pogona TaxID=333966 RepID=UPI00168566A5|nr:hypothetical protein [Saccharopolyspora pogona]